MSKRALMIVSLITLLIMSVAIAGQAISYALDVTYNSNGQIINPTPLANIASFMTIATIPGLPLCLASFVLGLIATAGHKQYSWLAAIVAAGVLAFVGLFGMAWVLLSENSPIAFVTPFVLIPLVTLLYSLTSGPQAAIASTTTWR